MIEALAGVLGAVHLRQPWLGGACLAFIAVLFFISFNLVNKMSKNDKYFQIDRRNYRF